MAKVFISYSSADRADVTELKQALENLGFDIWFDQDAILPGGYYAADIATALQDIDVFLLMTSANSIGDTSRNIQGSAEVAKEVILAQSSSAIIIPVKLDNCWMETASHKEFTYLLARTQWLDAGYCQTQEQYQQVAKRIAHTIENKAFTFNHDTTLDEIEQLLKKGLYSQASERMKANNFPEQANDRVVFINSLLELNGKSIGRISKLLADDLAAKLMEVRDERIKHAALYLLGTLSVYYYQANAIFDPTGGLANIKAQAAGLPRLKAKYVMAASHILPDNKYSLRWAQ